MYSTSRGFPSFTHHSGQHIVESTIVTHDSYNNCGFFNDEKIYALLFSYTHTVHTHVVLYTFELVLQMKRKVENLRQNDAAHRGIYCEHPSGICCIIYKEHYIIVLFYNS